MRYVMARLEKDTEDMIYRIYITDILRGLCGNIEIPRFADEVYNKYTSEETRTEQEIKEQIFSKLGD